MDIQKETPEKGIEEILQDIALYSAQDDIMEGNYVAEVKDVTELIKIL